MSLAASVWVVLALWHRSSPTVIEDVPEAKPASRSPLYTDTSDIILLSFNEPWKEAHTAFARLLQQPITAWSAESGAFNQSVMAAFFRGKKPFLVTVDTSKTPSTRQLPGVRWFTCSAFAWIQLDILALTRSTTLTPRRPGCEAGYLTMNETSVHSFFWPRESSTDLKPLLEDTFGKLKLLKRSRARGLGGRQITVACLKRMRNKGTENTCDDTSVVAVLTLLSRQNVTVTRVEAPDVDELFGERLVNNTDIVFFPIPVYAHFTPLFDFPLTRVVQDTFYSKVDAHRVVSLSEVAGECSKIVASTVALLVIVVLLSAVAVDKGRSISRHISDTALFLLAAVLATSANEPNMHGRAVVARKALLGLFLVSLLPLSVYFRTELTAIVTLRRPAYRIDTLKKLEDALDRRQVAPCVVKYTLSIFELRSNDASLPLQPLSQKLQLAFARHGEQELVTSDLSDCIRCASRADRVCYVANWRHPSSSLMKLRNVAAFVEHLKSKLVCFVMPKLKSLYWPLRRFFLAVEESKLIDWDSRDPEYDKAGTEFDMGGLLMLLVILHATSCLVLVLEVMIARHMRRG